MKGKRLLGIWMALLLAGAGLAKAENGQGLILSSGIPVDALHFYEAAHPEEPLEFAMKRASEYGTLEELVSEERGSMDTHDGISI